MQAAQVDVDPSKTPLAGKLETLVKAMISATFPGLCFMIKIYFVTITIS